MKDLLKPYMKTLRQKLRERGYACTAPDDDLFVASPSDTLRGVPIAFSIDYSDTRNGETYIDLTLICRAHIIICSNEEDEKIIDRTYSAIDAYNDSHGYDFESDPGIFDIYQCNSDCEYIWHVVMLRKFWFSPVALSGRYVGQDEFIDRMDEMIRVYKAQSDEVYALWRGLRFGSDEDTGDDE